MKIKLRDSFTSFHTQNKEMLSKTLKFISLTTSVCFAYIFSLLNVPKFDFYCLFFQ